MDRFVALIKNYTFYYLATHNDIGLVILDHNDKTLAMNNSIVLTINCADEHMSTELNSGNLLKWNLHSTFVVLIP